MHEQDRAARINRYDERRDKGKRQHKEDQDEAPDDVEPSFQHLLDGPKADERRSRKDDVRARGTVSGLGRKRDG